jgi:hypothetical protein
MNTATVIGLDLADDGVLLVKATCERCHKTVMHGASRDLDSPALGHRTGHCGCGGYELIDPNGVVPVRLRVIRLEIEAKERRRAHSRAMRQEADGFLRD